MLKRHHVPGPLEFRGTGWVAVRQSTKGAMSMSDFLHPHLVETSPEFQKFMDENFVGWRTWPESRRLASAKAWMLYHPTLNKFGIRIVPPTNR